MFSKCPEFFSERSASAQKHSQSSKHTWLDHCLCLSSDLLQVNAVIYCMFHLLVEQLLSARSQRADGLSVLMRYLWLTACIAFLRGQHVTEQLVYSKTLHAVGVSSCLMRCLCQNSCSWGACAMFYTCPGRSMFILKQVFLYHKPENLERNDSSSGKAWSRVEAEALRGCNTAYLMRTTSLW